MKQTCRWCGSEFPVKDRGRIPLFCSGAHRVAAHRARRKLPAELTSRRAWTRRDGKRPIRPDGRPASSTDPATWSDYRDVKSGAGDGVGVMLGGGLGCFDLDNCITEGGLTSTAEQFIDGISDPIWIERSLSGRGVHVFVHAVEAKGYRRGGVEFYSWARFIAVTGNPLTVAPPV